MNNYHTSVLLEESIELLNIQREEKYIDATLGGGGHTREIIERGGIVLSVDSDLDAIEFVKENLKSQISNRKLILMRGNFDHLAEIAIAHGFEKVSGILFDLGVSSHQFDTPERGFSFQHDAQLDMRMDRSLSVTAKDLINGLGRDELTELFTKLGEEPFARKIANQIVKARSHKAIETTSDLVSIVKSVVFARPSGMNPATKVFQALRIAVNDELNALKAALEQSLKILRPGGRVAVISFHSLEDRIVKEYFLRFSKERKGTILTDKPIIPSAEEIQQNPRSRSAKLRGFEKL